MYRGRTMEYVDKRINQLVYKDPAPGSRIKMLKSLLIRFILMVLVVYILFCHIVGLTIMPTGDMYPRIDAGDLLLYYRLESKIKAQDIVVFQKPTYLLDANAERPQSTDPVEKNIIRKVLDWIGFADPAEPAKTLLVCRVVAGPGDVVQITDNERLSVNGNTMIETNIFYKTPKYESSVEYPITLGDDEYFVLADSRTSGADSRYFGIVNSGDILGTVITILRRNNL